MRRNLLIGHLLQRRPASRHSQRPPDTRSALVWLRGCPAGPRPSSLFTQELAAQVGPVIGIHLFTLERWINRPFRENRLTSALQGEIRKTRMLLLVVGCTSALWIVRPLSANAQDSSSQWKGSGWYDAEPSFMGTLLWFGPYNSEQDCIGANHPPRTAGRDDKCVYFATPPE